MNVPLKHRIRGFFTGARDFTINNSQFYDIHEDLNAGRTGLDYLQQFISFTAIHDAQARYPPPKCHPGTREAVLTVINDWIDDANPAQRILWLNGPAGAGKSAIAQTIAEGRMNDRLVASFFFLRNDRERGAVDRLFTTLAWQMALSVPETRSYIKSTLKIDPLLPTKAIDIQFDRLFVQVFQNILPDFRSLKPLVIIDGVDECAGEQAQKHFLRLIGEALAQHNIPLRFLICSRPEPHIRDTFHLEVMESVTRPIVLDDGFADVQKYLKEELSRIFTNHNILPHPPHAQISRLVNKSSGQFIYASTVIKFVDDEYCNPRTQLDIILGLRSPKSSSPFAALDRLYIQILSQQPDTRLLRDVFALVIAFGKPKVDFICRRLRIRKDKLQLELRRMHSLLHITDYIIETYHRSVNDFFQDKRRAGKYHIHPVRVMLLRLPQKIQSFMDKIQPAPLDKEQMDKIRFSMSAGLY